jgi:isoamylase
VTEKGADWLLRTGRALPLGLSCSGICGELSSSTPQHLVNFSLHSASAKRVSLQLHHFDSGARVALFSLDPQANRSGDVWHIEIGPLDFPLRYSWLVDGTTLLDPRAQVVKDYHGFFPLAKREWKHPRPARLPMQDLVFYEVHVKGFTAHASSGVDSAGTYEGLIKKLPYLSDLGVTTLELMPVHAFDPADCVFINPDTGLGLRNYWGYDPISFMAPAQCYSDKDNPLEAAESFRDLVDACHEAGIEVVLDVVFNHTAEGNQEGPSFSFRGLDPDIWYMKNRDGHWLDYTGCGNTLNCNHPVVRSYILDCLRSWVVDMGVDGFRFDLAAVLGRDSDGRVLENAPVLDAIFTDPVLSNTRLIAEAWDAGGLVQVGSFQQKEANAKSRPAGDWAEWNGSFRDTMRRLIRGDKKTVAAAASRIAGSADLFQASGRSPASSLNFVTCHDGFTLADVVTYTEKRNLSNGESNRDGSNDNYSQNCGHEGPTDDPAILALRAQHQRNLLCLLFLSQGVPMLLAGDEMGRSQGGNNNAWCQDSETTWLNWELLHTEKNLHAFVKALIQFRKDHPQLRRSAFFVGGIQSGIRWHGVQVEKPDFGADSHALAWQIFARNRTRCESKASKSSECQGHGIYCAFNFWQDELHFELPEPPENSRWHRVIDTQQEGLRPGSMGDALETQSLCVGSNSVVVLLAHDCRTV